MFMKILEKNVFCFFASLDVLRIHLFVSLIFIFFVSEFFKNSYIRQFYEVFSQKISEVITNIIFAMINTFSLSISNIWSNLKIQLFYKPFAVLII